MTSRRLPLVLLVLLLALTACGGGDNPTPTAAESSAAAKGSPTPGKKAGGKAGGTTATESTAPSGSTTKPTSTAKAAAPKKASQSTPPAAGTYTYRQSGSMTMGGETYDAPERGTLEIAPAERVEGGTRSEQTRDLGRGGPMESAYLFTDDAVLLQEVTMQGFTCVLRPSLTALKIPLKVGAEWSDSATCSANGMSVTIEIDAEVLRKEDRRVGSRTVETFVLDLHSETTGAGFEQVQDATTWLSPEYRLPVRTKMTSRSESVYGNGTSVYTEQLVSLTPR